MSTRGRKGQKQLEILKYIYEQVQHKGYPPTVREIGVATDLSSTSTVHGHLSRLEKNGFILRDPAKPRAIEFTPEGLDKLGINENEDKIPLLGVVAAGEPILAVEDATDYFPIPNELELEKGNLFMLTIQGNSMIDVGILDGDHVIVRQQDAATNGDIVIAMTDDDEATCKRFYKEKDHVRLVAENEMMDPIILNDAKILGKVVSLYRSHIF